MIVILLSASSASVFTSYRVQHLESSALGSLINFGKMGKIRLGNKLLFGPSGEKQYAGCTGCGDAVVIPDREGRQGSETGNTIHCDSQSLSVLLCSVYGHRGGNYR